MCCAFLVFILTDTVAHITVAQSLHFQMPLLGLSKQARSTQEMFTYPTTQKSKGRGQSSSMYILQPARELVIFALSVPACDF